MKPFLRKGFNVNPDDDYRLSVAYSTIETWHPSIAEELEQSGEFMPRLSVCQFTVAQAATAETPGEYNMVGTNLLEHFPITVADFVRDDGIRATALITAYELAVKHQMFLIYASDHKALLFNTKEARERGVDPTKYSGFAELQQAFPDLWTASEYVVIMFDFLQKAGPLTFVAEIHRNADNKFMYLGEFSDDISKAVVQDPAVHYARHEAERRYAEGFQ